MTPAAHAAAAIAVLDAIGGGARAEPALSVWARRNRYAGSSDRSAIRDLVYDALRCRRTFAAWGGGSDGRRLILGGLRAGSRDPEGVFGAGRYAPPALAADERAVPHGPWPAGVALDCPDVLLPSLWRTHGDRLPAMLRVMQSRARVHVRANLRRVTTAGLAARLRETGIDAVAHPLSPSALTVGAGARRLRQTQAFEDGWFEFQDAASQAVADAVPVPPGGRVLDLCAGAGGKTLAMAARADAEWVVHDADPDRMRDFPARAARAGCRAAVLRPGHASARAPYDTMLVDAPCSGSGAWRRDPEAKWRLTPARLDALRTTQAGLLDTAATLVAAQGTLAYATCSLLAEENAWQVGAFVRRTPGWQCVREVALTPLDGGDGFYLALLRR